MRNVRSEHASTSGRGAARASVSPRGWLGIGLATLLALAAPALLAACGGGDALTVYSGRSESLIGPIFERFEQDTGIQLAVRYAGTGELTATLLEEGANSPADLFVAQDPASLVQIADLLDPLPDDLTAGVPPWAVDGQRRWVGISARQRVVAYNSDAVNPANLPATAMGYTAAEWGGGRLGWAPTNGSFQAMVAVMIEVWGESATRTWLEGIRANQPMAYSGNTALVAAIRNGEVDAGFTNHYYALRLASESGGDFAARNHHLDPGDPGGALLLSGAGVLASSDSKAAAQRLAQYLLGADAQTHLATQVFEIPLNPSVAPPSSTPRAADLARSPINFSDLRRLERVQELLRETGILQ